MEQREYEKLSRAAINPNFIEKFEELYQKTDNGFTKIQLLSMKRYLGITTEQQSVNEILPILKSELKKLKRRGLDQDTVDLLCQLWPTITPVLESESLLDNYRKRVAWRRGINNLEGCIQREKERFKGIHGL